MGIWQGISGFWFKGPHFKVITSEEAALSEALQESLAAVEEEGGDACVAPVTVEIVAAPSAMKKTPPTLADSQGIPAYRCTSALGTVLHNQQISEFNKGKQVYMKEELSPLPFQPPAFYEYTNAMIIGTAKVANYVVAVLVALMTIQETVSIAKHMPVSLDPWQQWVLFLFLGYPAVTLAGIVFTNNEMTVRRFMYYRLLSLQVIVDWDNRPLQRYWMAFYLLASTLMLNIYAAYGWSVASESGADKVGAQWSIVFGQCLLIGNFWYTLTCFEQQLISMNKVIENSPEAAKELITLCDVVTEAQLRHAIRDSYKRAKAYKRLSAEEQAAAKTQLLTSGASSAAFFDLLTLRHNTKGRKSCPEVTVQVDPDALPSCPGFKKWLQVTCNPAYRVYALNFALNMFSFKLTDFCKRILMCQSRAARNAGPRVAWWPYHDDDKYLSTLGALGFLTVGGVYCVMIYSAWLVFDALTKQSF